MSELSKLINELCPDGVEYKRLGGKNGICEVNASGVDKVVKEGERPVKLCNYMDVYSNQYINDELVSNFMDGSVNENEYQKFILRTGQVLLTKDSEAREDIAQTAYVCKDFDNVVCAYHLAVLQPKCDIDGRYLNYVLQSNDLRRYFSRMANGVSRFGLRLSSIENARIPVPPLPVQQQIVHILDQFTALEAELEAELKAELEARKKQYEYYCKECVDKLIEHPKMRLRDLGKWFGGGTPSKQNNDFWQNGTIPWVTSKDMVSAVLLGTQNHITPKAISMSSAKLIPANSIAFVVRSGILRHTLPIALIPFETAVNQDIKVLVTDSAISNKYVLFILKAYHDQLLNETKKQGGTVESIDTKKLLDFEIPVPSKDEQNDIADALEHYLSQINNLTKDLNAEIEARRKRYEHYRDKLLTFKEKVS